MNPSHIRNIVIKPGPAGRPGTQPTRRLDRFGFVKRPAGATNRQNLLDPVGQPMTQVTLENPGETRVTLHGRFKILFLSGSVKVEKLTVIWL